MTALNDLPDEEFRHIWRDWLAETYPDQWRVPFLRIVGDEERAFIRLLNEGGWRAPAWPVEFGGMGLSLSKQLIYQGELERVGAARIPDLGGTLLAPTLIRYGTHAQQTEYLPRILSGEDLWCQGYSEPGSGSDLASLRTAAVRDGDDFVINGQKIWTSMADWSDRIFMLVRTSTEGRKQDGITFILADLDSPGITVRPIENLSGDREFCEVFLDDVRVPAANVVGEVDAGWTVAKALLGTERIVTGSPTLARQAWATLDKVYRAADAADRVRWQDRVARLRCTLMDTEALYRDISAAAIAGSIDGSRLSLLKIATSELFQRTAEAAVELAGREGGMAGPVEIGGEALDLNRMLMLSRPATIYGGAGEIQRDIIARELMGAAT